MGGAAGIVVVVVVDEVAVVVVDAGTLATASAPVLHAAATITMGRRAIGQRCFVTAGDPTHHAACGALPVRPRR
jgi:hypothetical protein